MLSLTCYGGVGEIGGNKILLEDSHVSLFFDFGFPFKKRARYFEEYLNPRAGAGLLDLLEMEILPPLRGIYREGMGGKKLWERFRSRPLYRELTIDGVLLTHAHMDHSGYISFLRDDIPIYATTMTAFIAKAMQDSTPPNFEGEVCYSLPRESQEGYLRSQGTYRMRPFVFMDSLSISEEARAFWNSSPTKKKPLGSDSFRFAQENIGNLRVELFLVDHSIPGAVAFAVETSSGWVGYTGDLRFHGRGSGQSENFAAAMRELRPHILLCEGTRCGDQRGTSEEEAYENCLEAVSETRGLVIADFGARNVERLLTFHRIARQTGRNLVIMAKDAYLLDAMQLVSEEIPSIGDMPDIMIYKDFKSRLAIWEAEIHRRYHDKLISPSNVRENAHEIILCFSFWDLNDLIDIAPASGGTYIYSSAEVFDEEGTMDMWRLANWVAHFGIKAIGLPRGELNWEIPGDEKGFHSSGHASGPELLELIRRINPQILIPVHTEHPEYFVENLKGTGIEVCVPIEGQPMTFSRKR